MRLPIVAGVLLATLSITAKAQTFIDFEALEKADELTPEMVAEALERIEDERELSSMGQCAQVDGEERRFAASQALPEMKVALGTPLAELATRYPDYFEPDRADGSPFFSARMMRLSVDLGGEVIRLNTGGMGNVVTTISSTYFARRIYSLSAYHQQCPLQISVAIARAIALEEQLQRAGFAALDDRAPLLAIEEFARSGRRQAVLSTWLEAQEQLTTTPRAFSSVTSEWRRGQERARITVHNWGGAANPEGVALVGPIAERSVFELDDAGRKYGVELSLSHASMLEEDLDAHATTVETAP